MKATSTPIPEALWVETIAFLARGRSGRVTWHVDHGVVRKLELTAFVTDGEKGVDKKSDDRVESG